MPETDAPIRSRRDAPAGLDARFASNPPPPLAHGPAPVAAPPHDAAPPFAPVPPSVLEAARRRPLLVAGALLLALAAALALGLTRPAVYSATAQLRVGGFDVSVPGSVSGYATASVALATTYSYSVHEPAVVAAVARDLHIPRARVLDAVGASALPERPVLRVRAQAASARRAVALANATAVALAHRRIGVASPAQRAQRLRAYQRTAARVAALHTQLRARQLAYQSVASAPNGRALARTEAAIAAQQVALDAQRDAYVSGAQSATSTPGVELVAPARRALSDAHSTLQLYLIVALAAGLSAGLALALLVERRARFRRPHAR